MRIQADGSRHTDLLKELLFKKPSPTTHPQTLGVEGFVLDKGQVGLAVFVFITRDREGLVIMTEIMLITVEEMYYTDTYVIGRLGWLY